MGTALFVLVVGVLLLAGILAFIWWYRRHNRTLDERGLQTTARVVEDSGGSEDRRLTLEFVDDTDSVQRVETGVPAGPLGTRVGTGRLGVGEEAEIVYDPEQPTRFRIASHGAPGWQRALGWLFAAVLFGGFAIFLIALGVLGLVDSG